MTLNLSKKYKLFYLDFTKADFYMSSKYELPHCDMNVKTLFDTLETSIIIKLWSGILTEKQVFIHFFLIQPYLKLIAHICIVSKLFTLCYN